MSQHTHSSYPKFQLNEIQLKQNEFQLKQIIKQTNKQNPK